jgi:signal-transduction protein with cAMP-binding, CBS, and nucleotidyltransferase domain
MGTPPRFIDAAATVLAAAQSMRALAIGALLVEDGAPGVAGGIVTERDVLAALARDGAAALALPVGRIMSTPVSSVPENALLYVAIGRMERLGFRHLAVVDGAGRAVGVVSARTLLRLRATKALAIGDAVALAADAADLLAAQRALPALARALLDDEVSALKIAGVIASVLRDATARAVQLAEQGLAKDGWGGPPAPYALLVLGSGGRGESLLAADQDNAIAHAGAAADDPWFAELGKRVADTLDAAGIPYCKGGVMAAKPTWRHNLDGWRAQVAAWIRNPAGENLLSVDIFYDFRRACGDPGLADALRADAAQAAASSPAFLRLLAKEAEETGSALTMLGRFRSENGRVDLKKGGLFPIVAFARVAALKHGILETGTADRLSAAATAGAIQTEEADRVRQAQETLLRFILEQQISDLSAGIAPSTRVEIQRLSRQQQAQLKSTLKSLEALPLLLRDVLTAG